jgi:hypothetical protein
VEVKMEVEVEVNEEEVVVVVEEEEVEGVKEVGRWLSGRMRPKEAGRVRFLAACGEFAAVRGSCTRSSAIGRRGARCVLQKSRDYALEGPPFHLVRGWAIT